MKSLALAVVVLLSLAGASFAQTAAVPAPAAKPASVGVKALSGKVDAVVVADPVKGTKSSLEVSNAQGQKARFLVETMTVIMDAAGKPVALGSLANGTSVEVAFITTKSGAQQAIGIKEVK